VGNYKEDPAKNEHDENDQHAVRSLANGEQFIFDVYQTVKSEAAACDRRHQSG
jgi:hypothetical protein